MLDHHDGTDGIARSAELSDCHPVPLFRYTLSRVWNDAAYTLPFIMLNPSTADHMQDDPTILTCMRFARRDGFGGIFVANLMARRSPHPSHIKALDKAYEDVIGPGNDAALEHLFESTAFYGTDVVCAWGNGGLEYPARVQRVLDLACQHDVRLVHLGLTAHGAPKHPLARGKHRIPADQKFAKLEFPR